MTDLEARLLTLGYTELFQRLDDDALDELWREPEACEALKLLALDDSRDPWGRFLAAEVIFSRRPDAFSSDDARRVTSALYATALRRQFTGSANEWGLPGQTVGRAGEHLLSLGMSATAALVPMLTDETPVLYEGSKDAMVGAAYHYRVKDLAAQFIARLTDLSFPLSEDPTVRDAAIAEMQRQFA